MPHQINLYNPILLAPRRHFSATAMLQGLAVFAAALAGLSAWSAWRTQALQQELALATRLQASEQQALAATLAASPGAGGDVSALTAELAQARQALADAQARHARLGGDGGPLNLLQQLSASLPQTVWLTELRLRGHTLELSGLSLRPEALQPWLAAWASHPINQGQPPTLLRVERRADGAPGGAEAWAFRVVQGAGPVSGGGR